MYGGSAVMNGGNLGPTVYVPQITQIVLFGLLESLVFLPRAFSKAFVFRTQTNQKILRRSNTVKSSATSPYGSYFAIDSIL